MLNLRKSSSTSTPEEAKAFKKLNDSWSLQKSKVDSKLIGSFLNAGSIKSIFHQYQTNTGILNTLIQGGRTNNEEWWNITKSNAFDVDIAGCYTNTLQAFSYPVGLPSIYAYADSDKKRITLRDFLTEYERELIEGLYTITISGKLNFSQNLLYSKIIENSTIAKKHLQILNELDDQITEDVNEDFVLLERELKNTILTSDLLKALKNICRPVELKEIMDCTVDTAMFYKKSDKKSPQEFNKVFEGKSRIDHYFYEIDSSYNRDIRPKAWMEIPFKDLIVPLKELRKHYKDLGKQGIDVELNDGMQNLIKLIINTIYGVLASLYFDVGNTVVANNKTARARLGVWMVGRSVKGLQDGCMYTPDYIYEIKDNSKKKPALETLSDYRKLEKHRSIQTIHMGHLDWSQLFKKQKTFDDYPSIDVLVNQHVKNFWKNYNIDFPYELEHKLAHIATDSFYIKKAHYMYKDFTTGEVLYKIRGLSSSEMEGSVYKKIGDILLKGEEKIIDSLQHTAIHTTRIFEYLYSKTKGKIKLPGVKETSIKNFHLNNLDLPYIDLKDYKFRQKNPTKYEDLFLNQNTMEAIDQIYQLRINNHITFMKYYLNKK